MDRRTNIARFPGRADRKPVKVVAVTGGKGGVGKSSICANVALALAMAGQRVMLLDGDLGLASAHLLLGLQPRRTLRHVVRGECTLMEAISHGPAGLQLLAGANGFADMARLSVNEHAGIVNCFGEYESRLDVLMVDTAPGISDSVMQFAGAASHALIVVRDEPASIADAYSIIKLLNAEKSVEHFDVVTNMTSPEAGMRVFQHLLNIVERFLAVRLTHAGNVPCDDKLVKAVRCRRPVIAAFPRSSAAKSLIRLARRIDGWGLPTNASGRVEFFVDRLIATGRAEGTVQEAVS
jgi:flagellar biosynthesis protein FlhG